MLHLTLDICRFWATLSQQDENPKIVQPYPTACFWLCIFWQNIYRHPQFTVSFPLTAILTPNGTEIMTRWERRETQTWRRPERTCFTPQCVVGISLHLQFIIQRQQAFQHLPKHQLTSIKRNIRTEQQIKNPIRAETRVIKRHMWVKIDFAEVTLQWLGLQWATTTCYMIKIDFKNESLAVAQSYYI